MPHDGLKGVSSERRRLTGAQLGSAWQKPCLSRSFGTRWPGQMGLFRKKAVSVGPHRGLTAESIKFMFCFYER
jgi:hypothetical protein